MFRENRGTANKVPSPSPVDDNWTPATSALELGHAALIIVEPMDAE